MKRYLCMSVLLVACAIFRVGAPPPKRSAKAKGRGQAETVVETATSPKPVATPLIPRFRIALASLPEKRILGGAPSVEFAPRALMEASERLGRLRAELRDNPALLDEGLKFYRECANEEEVLTSIRAYCLRAVRDLSRRVGHEVASRDFARSVWHLSERLPAVD